MKDEGLRKEEKEEANGRSRTHFKVNEPSRGSLIGYWLEKKILKQVGREKKIRCIICNRK